MDWTKLNLEEKKNLLQEKFDEMTLGEKEALIWDIQDEEYHDRILKILEE